MDIEEELAELRAELEKMKEDPKLIRFVNSKEYRQLVKKNKPQICEICGKEYKITHLCEANWSFNWSDFQKHYEAKNPPQSALKEAPKPVPQIKKEIITTKQTYIPNPQPAPAGKKKSSFCGVCCCILIIGVLIVIFRPFFGYIL
jgi:hypothetical protein